MTEQDPGEGFFDHLDDPSWSAPDAGALPSVVRRGRQLRARRRTAFAASATLGVTAAVIGGLGVAHAFNADGPGDRVVTPASPGTSVPATASARGHHGGSNGSGGTQVLSPGATGAPGVQPSPGVSTPPAAPSPEDGCSGTTGDTSGDQAPPDDPGVTSSLPPLAPSPTPTCESSTPTPTASPSESASAQPTDTAEPSESPS